MLFCSKPFASTLLLLASVAALAVVGCSTVPDEPQTASEPKVVSSPAKKAKVKKIVSAGNGQAAAWSYRGKTGPEQWGRLSPEYALCSRGKNQSPLRVEYPAPTTMPELLFNYDISSSSIENDGKTIRVGQQPGSSLWFDSRRFELLEYHFHAEGEHIIDGRAYPLEAHLVHQDADGNIAVVAVFYEEGERDEQLTAVMGQLPAAVGRQGEMQVGLLPERLLPRLKMYYRYNGSLTTPPCSEGVLWILMRYPRTASAKQLQDMKAIMGGGNARPAQPLNARRILEQ